MKSYGNLELAEGSDIVNMTVATGTTLPATTANIAELFYKTGTAAGLYVYNGSSWTNLSLAASGGNTLSYAYQQSTASTTWNINHNLNTTNITYSFMVYVSSTLTPIMPSALSIIDANNITVTFSVAYTGTATIVGSLA